MKMDSKRLLVIDDDVEECMILKEAIQHVENTIEFLCIHDTNKLAAVLDSYQPAIVLTDMSMPQLSGIECLKEIKSRYPDVPVIVYSGFQSKDQIIKAYDCGSELVIQKPNSFTMLVDMMQEILTIDWTNNKQLREKYYGNLVTFPLNDQQNKAV